MTIPPACDAPRGMMFAARNLSEKDRWDDAGKLIRQIVALERATHPHGGTETQDGKDARARAALDLAGQLVRVVAGWAIDHVAGVAANAASDMEPTSPDDHRHESRGWELQEMPSNAETIGRKVLIQLIACNPGAFPQSVQQAAVESLEALEYGEVLPLVTPTKINRHRRLCELRYQLQALKHVEYRSRLLGAKVSEARAIVARAYGIEPETLRTAWTYRVPKELPPGEAECAFEEARRDAAASIVIRADTHVDDIDIVTRVHADGTCDIGPDPYSDAALRTDGQAYYQYLGTKKRAMPRPRKVLRRSQNTQHDRL